VAKNLNRTNVSVLSLTAPWALAALGASLGFSFEQKGYETVTYVATRGSIVVGELVAVYCAYLYVRDKKMHGLWAWASVLSLWGWIVLWLLPDRGKA